MSVAAVAALVGCSQSAPPLQAESSPNSDAIPSVSVNPDGVEQPDIAQIREASGPNGQHIVSVESPQVRWLNVQTNLVDPGTNQSTEAAKAVAICTALKESYAEAWDDFERINVVEKDGTHWVLYGHPAVPAGECAET